MVTEKRKYDAVILADGDFPTSEEALEVLRNAAYLCCCDGAVAKCVERNIMPAAIVGDGDSIPKELKERFHNLLHLESEQADNDLTKATRHCFRQGFKDIAYLGATGLREDHIIGNVFLMERYMREFGIRPMMFTDYGYFIPAQGTATFCTFPRQQVSVFNISCTTLASKGLRWDTYPYKGLWQGSLNEAVDKEITINGDGNYILYFTYKAK